MSSFFLSMAQLTLFLKSLHYTLNRSPIFFYAAVFLKTTQTYVKCKKKLNKTKIRYYHKCACLLWACVCYLGGYEI